MRPRVLPWLATFTALGLGCRALVDLEGLTDGELARDAGPTSDSGARDGAVSGDTGVDAVVKPEAGATFCQTAPGPSILCEDFEQPLLQRWNITSQRAQASVDTTRGAASGASFHAQFDSPAGSDSYVGWTSNAEAPDTATTTSLEAKYWFDAAPVSSVEINAIVIQAGVSHYVFFALDNTMQLSLIHEHEAIGGGSYYGKDYPTGQTIPLGRWVKLRIEVDPGAPAARGYVDDALVVQHSLENTLGPGPSQATLGGWMPEAPTPFELWTDDVLFRAQ